MEGKIPPNNQSGPPSITLERMQQLLDAYGASPDRWSPEERKAALALLEHSTEARAQRAAAARLDTMLDLVPAEQPSPQLAARVLAAASPEREESANLAVFERTRAAARGTLARDRRARTWRYLAAVAPLAAAAAVALWLTWAPEPSPRGPMQLAIAELGTYETPTDALLTPPGFDLFRTVPSLGCPDSPLGCPNLDFPRERESRLHSMRRTQA